jgi:hypothetical protein
VTTLSTGDAVAAGGIAGKDGWSIAFDTVTIPGHGSFETRDAVVARYDRSGKVIWAEASLTDGFDGATTIANDGADGLLVAGGDQGGDWFGAGSGLFTSAVAARLASSGAVSWARPLVSLLDEPIQYPYQPEALSVVATPSGLAAAGQFTGTVHFQSANQVDYSSKPMAGYVATLTVGGDKRGFVPYLATGDAHADAVTLAANGDLFVALSYSGLLALADGAILAQGGSDVALLRVPAPTAPATAIEPPVVDPLPPGPTACRPPPAPGPAPPVGPDPTFATEAAGVDTGRAQFPSGVAIDLGGNGTDDLLIAKDDCGRCGPVGDYGGPLLVLENRGAALVDATATLLPGPVDFWGPTNPPVDALDLDGDGRTDLFTGQAAYDRFPWYGDFPLVLMQQADGSLRDESPGRVPIDPRLTDPSSYGYSHYHDIADIDCAGHPAAFLTNIASFPKLPSRLLTSDGHGRFFVDQTGRVPDTAAEGSFTAGVFCDVNRDGAPDLVLGDNLTGSNLLLLNDGSGRFHEAAGALPNDPYGADGASIYLVCIDVNRDGWNDILFHSTKRYQEHLNGLWINQGDGTFVAAPATALPEPLRSSYEKPIYVVDLNGDGWPDLVAGGSAAAAAINNGDGTFHDLSSIFPAVTSFQYGVVPFDVDGDGKKDLFVFYSDMGDGYVLRNTTP